jgi:hypothetical protein
LSAVSFDTIPASMAIALAVSRLSPVTILILIPALWHFLTDSTISSLKGSYKANMLMIVNPSFSKASLSASAWKSLFFAFNSSYRYTVKST